MKRTLFACAAALLLLALLAPAALTQEGEPRRLAPGVMTVIPRNMEEAETFSGPREFVELAEVAEEWEPNTLPESAILAEISQDTVFRHDVWQVEFAFKPLRMIEVDVPQPNGLLERKLIWYLVFRVRNPGQHLRPTPGVWERDDNGELVESTVTLEIDPQTGQPLQLEGTTEFDYDRKRRGVCRVKHRIWPIASMMSMCVAFPCWLCDRSMKTRNTSTG